MCLVALSQDAHRAVLAASASAAFAASSEHNSATWKQAWSGERAAQAALLRDVFGPAPFRAVSSDAAWLAWRAGTLKELALSAYEDRLPDGRLDQARLAVLGDALADAGCANDELLAACRSASEKYRGLWVVDLLLDKS
jgi:hypothetical protein